MESLISTEPVDELRAAYSEMLGNCLKYPDKWEWFTMWVIELHDGTHIGGLCFKGIDTDGVAEIGYGISEEYQSKGYATEAVKAISDWAFKNPNLNAIEAEADPDNIASIRVLEKCGFIANGKFGKEKGFFALTNKLTGETKFIEVALDYDYGEQLLQKAERIYAALAANEAPDACDDISVCENCSLAHICGQCRRIPADVDIDEELDALIERKQQLAEAKKEYAGKGM